MDGMYELVHDVWDHCMSEEAATLARSQQASGRGDRSGTRSKRPSDASGTPSNANLSHLRPPSNQTGFTVKPQDPNFTADHNPSAIVPSESFVPTVATVATGVQKKE